MESPANPGLSPIPTSGLPDFPTSGLPQYLKKGDKIAIVCPAKKLSNPMTDAVALLQSWGLEVILGETVAASYHQFAGDDELRAKDMQRFIDDDSVKAIIAARGGYGTVRMIDKVDFTYFAKNPKWLVGFSDITVLHTHLFANYGMQTIHGQMPVNIPDASARSLNTLRKALFGEELTYEFTSHTANRTGDSNGLLIGGNLSLLVAVSGSVSDINYTGKVLFIEDVGEYLYSIDRMLRCLDRAGKLKNLAGLVVGGFTDVKDNDIPFGQTVPEIIMDIVQQYNYPVCFNFPAGHIPDNCSLILGRNVTLSVGEQHSLLKFI
ncbi:S66 peptidase family protein [Mucilaginibacter ginsenosidivorax]|uniref:LD-carboxypeptidase n=1 Tax=Mucilaginibacter ginsenosidivorax TaxID=862126 RepID=A0A5B8W1K5_9SPHI|nr:LD-carboxypeptidase [Mucilaginibacter ginsenosidivorax]QEC76782.1 LD-carboxypeptidase [Mucilaginibacter ginsenosidivorax]